MKYNVLKMILRNWREVARGGVLSEDGKGGKLQTIASVLIIAYIYGSPDVFKSWLDMKLLENIIMIMVGERARSYSRGQNYIQRFIISPL